MPKNKFLRAAPKLWWRITAPLDDARFARCDDCPACYIMWEDYGTGYREAGCVFTGKEIEGCWKPRRLIAKRAANIEAERAAADAAQWGLEQW